MLMAGHACSLLPRASLFKSQTRSEAALNVSSLISLWDPPTHRLPRLVRIL